jgi:carbon-monoxide dehydrogenase large subunit
MTSIPTSQPIARNGAARDYLVGKTELGLVHSGRIDSLNIEAAAFGPSPSANRKWAIRFNADGTITIVLGMRDYGRGWFSAYFAGLVSSHLGIPFGRVRIYHSATLPAVLQTPVPFSNMVHRSNTSSIAKATEIIEAMCDQVIERGRMIFAAVSGTDAINVRFNKTTGRFSVLASDRSSSLLEIAEEIRDVLDRSIHPRLLTEWGPDKGRREECTTASSGTIGIQSNTGTRARPA